MKAVLFVDVQNDFVTGALAVPGAKETTVKILEFARECRARGYALFATCDTHYAKGSEEGIAYEDTLEGSRIPPHCIEGTDGHKLVEGLVKDGNGDVLIHQKNIIDKVTFGSEEIGHDIARFIRGALEEELDEIIICGFCTSICVVSNALILRAAFPNVNMTVRADLCGDITPEAHEAALAVMHNCMIDVAR